MNFRSRLLVAAFSEGHVTLHEGSDRLLHTDGALSLIFMHPGALVY